MESQTVDAEVVSREIGPAIDSALDNARILAASIVDDASCDRAVTLAVEVKAQIEKAKSWRSVYYEPAYRAAENLRSFCDPRIKQGEGILKLLASSVTDYNLKKKREAAILREKAEAEARRQREEAAKRQRELEMEQARIKQAAEEAERQRVAAEAAERHRVAAEAAAKEKAEADARRRHAEEVARKIKEEEDARIAHAQEAKDVGSADKVDSILERATPIAPVVAPPLSVAEESVIAAEKAAIEKAAADRLAAEKAARIKAEDDMRLLKARQEAEKAAQAAAEAAAVAAASSAIVATRPDSRIRTNVTWKWTCENKEKFLLLVKAVAEDRAPVEYLGFDPMKPEKFRPAKVGEDVVTLKGAFECDGITVWPQENSQFLTGKVAI